MTAVVEVGPLTLFTEKLKEVAAGISEVSRPSNLTWRMSEVVPCVKIQLSLVPVKVGIFEMALQSTMPGEVDVATNDWY